MNWFYRSADNEWILSWITPIKPCSPGNCTDKQLSTIQASVRLYDKEKGSKQLTNREQTVSQPTTVSAFHCECTELSQCYNLKTEWGLQSLCGTSKQGSQLCSKDVTRSRQQRPESATETLTWHASKYKVHVNFPKGMSSKDWGCILRMYLLHGVWCTLQDWGCTLRMYLFGGVWCTLHLIACQMRVNYHKHFRSLLFSVCVMSSEH